jgi:hypothetical protein
MRKGILATEDAGDTEEDQNKAKLYIIIIN